MHASERKSNRFRECAAAHRNLQSLGHDRRATASDKSDGNLHEECGKRRAHDEREQCILVGRVDRTRKQRGKRRRKRDIAKDTVNRDFHARGRNKRECR